MATNFTKEEITLLDGALEQAIISAQRQQKQRKEPMIQEVFKKQETVLRELQIKLQK